MCFLLILKPGTACPAFEHSRQVKGGVLSGYS